MKTQKLPDHLSAAAVALYGDLAATCRLETERDRQRLLAAVELWQRAEDCRLKIEADGVTILDRFEQVKPHPLLIAERSSRVAYSRLLESMSQLSVYELKQRELAAAVVVFEEDDDQDDQDDEYGELEGDDE